MGASRIRHSLRPLMFRGWLSWIARTHVCRENEEPHLTQRRHAPRKRGVQYAAPSRLKHKCLWDTGSPGHRRAEATPSFGRLCRATTTERVGCLKFESETRRPDATARGPSGNPKFPSYRRILGYPWIVKPGDGSHEKAGCVCGFVAVADFSGGESG